jgi:hypothetical protein
MASDAVDQRSTRPLLTLGRVHLVRVQVGYRAGPDGPVHQQFLLDLPVPENGAAHDPDALDETRVLAGLEPVLHAGTEPPRHYSLHTHRWHTSWGASPGALELGLLVTAGTASSAVSDAWLAGVTRAFRGLMDLVGRPEPAPTSRDAALQRARHSVATTYGLDPDALSPSAEEHHAGDNSWTVALRATAGEAYDVVVGLVDGYAGSVRVRHRSGVEVSDSVGSE